MGTIGWLIGGFALLGISGLLEGLGDGGTTPVERLPYYIPSLIALMGAPLCFIKAIRNVTADIFGKKPGKSRASSATAQARPARRLAELADEAPQSDFDADEVFARYMARRAAEQTTPPASSPETQDRQPAGARPAFGRKVV